VAFAAGLLEASDFNASARSALNRMARLYWPQVAGMHSAARLACTQVLELQRTAAQLIAEMERAQRLAARAARGGDAGQLHRQRQRLHRVQAQLRWRPRCRPRSRKRGGRVSAAPIRS